MNLLITGGCGFLGSNLAASALGKGIRVTVLDNLSRLGATDNLDWLRQKGPVIFAHGDVRNAHEVDRIVAQAGPDVIFHVAGQVAMTTSLADPRYDFETNAFGTFNVLDAVRRYAPQCAVIYSSTNKVYGGLTQYRYQEDRTRWRCIDRPNGFSEDTPLEFHSPYGCSKGAADQYMLDAHRMWGLKTIVFRHSSMYGGRQFATYDQGWIGWFCRQAVEQSRVNNPDRAVPFTISGDGKQVRDVLHADDMVSLYFAGVAGMNNAAGQVFNIGGGMANSLSLLELFRKLQALVGTPLRYTHLPPRASDQVVFVADIAKAERLLGWKPVVGVDDGLARMVEWTRNQFR